MINDFTSALLAGISTLGASVAVLYISLQKTWTGRNNDAKEFSERMEKLVREMTEALEIQTAATRELIRTVELLSKNPDG